MLRIFLFVFVFGMGLSSLQAQLWLDVGVKGAFGPTHALNKNINDESGYTYNVTTGTAFGGKIGINFGANHGFAVEGLFANNKAGWDYKESGNTRLNSMTWKATDLLLLYRYQGQGAYFEIGPKYSIMGDVEQSAGGENYTYNENHFENYMSGVIGFGSYLAGSSSLQVILGVRIHYSFQDMISAEGFADDNLPTFNYNTAFNQQEKTSPIAAQLSLEINFVLGYVGKQFCYDKWRLMSFD